jgi:hypothetical protein
MYIIFQNYPIRKNIHSFALSENIVDLPHFHRRECRVAAWLAVEDQQQPDARPEAVFEPENPIIFLF